MSDHTKELHDPAAETQLEEPLDDGTSSGILLDKADYESTPEVTSLSSSAIFEQPEDAEHLSEKKPAGADIPKSITVPTTVSLSTPATTSTALSTEVLDLNQTMPWKLFYPLISRETILAICKATAINFLLPFVNGVFLGFGEICAHELTYRWGWTNSAHVVSVPGRRPVAAGNVGIRAAGASGAGSSGYAGSSSGIGGLGRYDEEFIANDTKRRQY
ncbi:pentafunctional AROM polypeptide [Entomortierella parvispora]|uniref:Pentafunctional AROM polypeptide n=1 Tax=Entomortierella parvispora TaxID=205924 RepID=A0A9P3LSW7_9FUNG|nr:pentafunctional AROM polypeptide [Entomortierella parvispora]